MATDSVTVSPTFNGDSVSLTSGMIVRLKPGANNNVVRAQADSAPHVQGVNGVVVSGASAPTGIVTVVCTGRETVQMESGLTPSVGDTVYVSPNVAGKGTNVLPGQPLSIGSIADISNYTQLGTAEVDVNVVAIEPGAGGTFPGFGPAPPNSTAVSSAGIASTAARSDHTHGALTADWPIANTRFFACDTTNGSDANAGFSDISQAAAGAVAVKTIAKLLSIMPIIGNGRLLQAAIRSGNYVSDSVIGLNYQGYAQFLIYTTDTVATAGATAFAGDIADKTACGMTTATGMNAAGYNATAYSVAADGTPTFTAQLAGGGAPGFGAMPARPYGCRLRGVITTPTGALQNYCAAIITVIGGNQLILSLPLPANPVTGNAGDVFVIEMPNVVGPTLTTLGNFGSVTSSLATLAGLSLGTVEAANSCFQLAGCEAGALITYNCFTQLLGQYSSGGTIRVGALRLTQINSEGDYTTIHDTATTTTTAPNVFVNPTFILYERSATGGGMIVYGGGNAANGNNIVSSIGTNSSTNHGAACQHWGAGTPPQGDQQCGLLVNGPCTLGRVKFSNMGTSPCARFNGTGLGLNIYGLSGGIADGNLDVGVDLTPLGVSGNTTGALGCTISVTGAPTVTGSNGDIRMADGTIVSWTNVIAGGYADGVGNRWVSASAAANPPLQVFISPEIDATAVTLGIPVVPGIPGKSFVPAAGRGGTIYQDVATGNLSTGASLRVGSNSPPTNFISAATGIADLAAIFPLGSNSNLNAAQGSSVSVPGAAVVADNFVAATGTGGFAQKYRIAVVGFYM